VIRGRRIKLRYAHQGGTNPPTIIIHGNQTRHVPDTYRRYLENAFRKVFKLTGTPVRIIFKSGENPFAGKKRADQTPERQAPAVGAACEAIILLKQD
jgi:GTP-binding protein